MIPSGGHFLVDCRAIDTEEGPASRQDSTHCDDRLDSFALVKRSSVAVMAHLN